MNKFPAVVLAALCLLLGVFALADETQSRSVDIPLVGAVTNVTVGKSTGVTLRITSSDGVTFRAKGAYDSNNLFGHFDVPGKIIKSGSGSLCLQFTGEIEFGDNDGSGFPSGTKTTYVMSIMLGEREAKGVYHIGKILPDIDWEQYGTMDLSRISKAQP